MSVKVDLYTAIKTQLETLTFLENVLHYNGQDLLNYEKDHAKRFPQSWIQLSAIDWTASEIEPHNSNRSQQQKGNATITIYYASYALSDDTDTFETDLGNIDLIYRALIMLDSTNFSPLQRAIETDDATNNNVRVWSQQFTTQLTEQALADTLTDAAPVELTIIKTIV